jgi:hypothetical protein
VQLGQESNQVLKAAAEPIDAPGHHHVELALSSVPAERIECATLVAALGARNPVILVDLDDGMLIARFLRCIEPLMADFVGAVGKQKHATIVGPPKYFCNNRHTAAMS